MSSYHKNIKKPLTEQEFKCLRFKNLKIGIDNPEIFKILDFRNDVITVFEFSLSTCCKKRLLKFHRILLAPRILLSFFYPLSGS